MLQIIKSIINVTSILENKTIQSIIFYGLSSVILVCGILLLKGSRKPQKVFGWILIAIFSIIIINLIISII
jgi:cytochrome b561